MLTFFLYKASGKVNVLLVSFRIQKIVAKFDLFLINNMHGKSNPFVIRRAFGPLQKDSSRKSSKTRQSRKQRKGQEGMMSMAIPVPFLPSAQIRGKMGDCDRMGFGAVGYVVRGVHLRAGLSQF